MKSEFARVFDVRQAEGKAVTLVANEAERAALTERFEIVRIDRLEAAIVLFREGSAVNATGTLSADIVQSCAVSAEDLRVAIREPLALRFVPESEVGDEEVELDADELDEIPYAGSTFDLGEAVAQTLALTIDPFAVGPQAEEARRKAGIASPEASGPFAALAALKKDTPKS